MIPWSWACYRFHRPPLSPERTTDRISRFPVDRGEEKVYGGIRLEAHVSRTELRYDAGARCFVGGFGREKPMRCGIKKPLLLVAVFVCAIGLIVCVQKAFGQDPIDLMWKARGLQAMEKIEQFNARLKANPEEKLPLKIKLEMMIEFAYAQMIAGQEIRNMVVKKGPGGVSYHLILNYGEKGVLDIFYTYPLGGTQCVAMTIARLPKGYCIGLPSAKEGADMAIFTNPDDSNEPGIVFSRSNPFLCTVTDSTTPEQPGTVTYYGHEK
jgi:hypothetical protein